MTCRLIADIGGTNARFAMAEDGRIGEVLRLSCAPYPRFADVLGEVLRQLAGAEGAAEVAIAAAGPVAQDEIDVTNLPWRIRAEEVRTILGAAEVRLLNDLEAVALALPHLTEENLAPMRRGQVPAERRPMIAINVGSGFGAATAVPAGQNWTALAGEPGHMHFAAVSEPEWQQVAQVTSVEDILSGRGLADLYRRLGGNRAEDSTQVFAEVDGDPVAAEAVELFATILGRISGDLLLAAGAWGGAFLCGGLICHPRGERFERAFFEAFDAKGAMASRIARVPVYRIAGANPALQGLAAMRF